MMEMFKALLGYRKQISRNDVCEDMRKIGVAMMIAGVVGVVLSGDTVSVKDGFALIFLGCIIWIVGLSIRRMQS